MEKEKKSKLLEKELAVTIQRERRRNYIILYAVILVIFFTLLFVSLGNGYFSMEEFIVNVVNNIIGILPPILIFDFFNEKLTRDASAAELSMKITETLMGNSNTLELFSEEQRKEFLQSTVSSIISDDDVTEMINDNLMRYVNIDEKCRVRKAFSYDLVLEERITEGEYSFISNIDDYFNVQQKLFYRIKYLQPEYGNMSSQELKIAFLFENSDLDNVLVRDEKKDVDFENCIFSENLDIKHCDMQQLKSKKAEEICRMFRLDLQVDNKKAKISSVIVKDKGIVFKLKADFDVTICEHGVRIIFHMPKRWNSIIEIAMVDPTKGPRISLSYAEEAMKVDMITFLSKNDEYSVDATHEKLNGIYDVSLTNEWIYPLSGMVFYIQRKK